MVGKKISKPKKQRAIGRRYKHVHEIALCLYVLTIFVGSLRWLNSDKELIQKQNRCPTDSDVQRSPRQHATAGGGSFFYAVFKVSAKPVGSVVLIVIAVIIMVTVHVIKIIIVSAHHMEPQKGQKNRKNTSMTTDTSLSLGLSLGVLFGLTDNIGLGMMIGVDVGLCGGSAAGAPKGKKKETSDEEKENGEK